MLMSMTRVNLVEADNFKVAEIPISLLEKAEYNNIAKTNDSIAYCDIPGSLKGGIYNTGNEIYCITIMPILSVFPDSSESIFKKKRACFWFKIVEKRERKEKRKKRKKGENKKLRQKRWDLWRSIANTPRNFSNKKHRRWSVNKCKKF